MNDDVCSNYHGGNPQSRDAHASIARMKEAMRMKIEARLEVVPAGRTCDELEEDLAFRHQTASARISELVIVGRVIRTKIRRPTRSGRSAAVIVLPKNWKPEYGIAPPRRAAGKQGGSNGRS